MSIDTGYATLAKVLDQYEMSGWAAEFGVFSGFSLSMIAEHMPVIGFDSFEGLPEDWRPGFPKGKFAGKLPTLPAYGHNVMIQKGWFSDTVPSFPFPSLGLVHIDCDLYSSTVTALSGVSGYIGVGTIVVFDEYHGYPGWEAHEAKAWHEFCAHHKIIHRVIAEGPEEKAFLITKMGVKR